MDREFLKKTIIFKGMTEDELDDALKALMAREREYDKDGYILHAGDTTDDMGLVLEGSVRIETSDIWGDRTILSHVGKGGFFAETYALMKDEPLLVDAVANERCRVLFLSTGHLSSRSQDPALWRVRLMSNLLTISTRKNLVLSGRSLHTSTKSIRGRVTAYLSSVSLQEGSNEFDIPFDRQQLADYLNIERTALSKELSKMQKDGMISVRKSHFRILSAEHGTPAWS